MNKYRKSNHGAIFCGTYQLLISELVPSTKPSVATKSNFETTDTSDESTDGGTSFKFYIICAHLLKIQVLKTVKGIVRLVPNKNLFVENCHFVDGNPSEKEAHSTNDSEDNGSAEFFKDKLSMKFYRLAMKHSNNLCKYFSKKAIGRRPCFKTRKKSA